jgi:DNA-binding response OmpR family regulator
MTRILVVETEARARHALRLILEGAGYDVEVAATSVEAGRMFNDNPAELVVTDAIDAQARLSFAGARMLAVPGGCAGREHEVAERVLAMGVNHILPKPFRRDALLDAVRFTLDMTPPKHETHPN